MKSFIREFLLLFLVGASVWADDLPASRPTVYLIGDSTVAEKSMDPPQPERGWGQAFRNYFSDPKMVSNHAMDGRSTKSFLDEERWQYICERLKPGDYVIIQFGHNDEKKEDPTRFTDPQGAYRENLMSFVRQTREKGAFPILATPVCRRRFDEKGKFFDTHGTYPDAVRAVAKDQNVPLFDLQRETEKLIEAWGPEKSKELFLDVKPGEYASLPQGRVDNTHFSETGAQEVARIVLKELNKDQLPITTWLKPEYRGGF